MFNTDSIIFISFLMINLVVGLRYGKNVKTLEDYALGGRNFSTVTIAATLIATWVSGETFFSYLSEGYSDGLYMLWAGTIGDVLCFLLVGYIFAPRLQEFLGTLSIADAMKNLYCTKVQIVTAFTGLLGASGLIAIQLKVAGLLFHYCFMITEMYGVIISGAIIIIYTTFGGIKSVTFTDLIQFLTFGTIVPTLIYFILSTMPNVEILIHNLTNNPIYNYKDVFNFTKPKSLYYLFIFLFIAVPAFNPAIFQRIAMAKNVKQVKQSFIIAGLICGFLSIMMSWISVLVLSIKNNLNANDIVNHIISNYSYIVGLRGLTLAGIMAMVMSTTDSYINSSAILFVNDFCKPLKIKIAINDVISARTISLLIGIISIILALRSGSLMELVITTNSFYMPIVTVPFIMALFGFRSTSKSVLIGMASGFITVVLWDIILKITIIDGLVPGMLMNLALLLISHYLLKQEGGWIGIKDKSALNEAREIRKRNIKKYVKYIKNFNFLTFCHNNSPKKESLYVYFGLFCIISMYSTMHTLPKAVQLEHTNLLNILLPSVLFAGTVLFSYPLWLDTWKQKKVISILWNVIVFYVLICVGFILVIISNYAPLQLMIFMVNLIVISCLIRWQWALLMLIFGLIFTIALFKGYYADSLPDSFTSLEFKIVYTLLFSSSILIMFIKPKQEEHDLIEEKMEIVTNDHDDKKLEYSKALAAKDEFIRNLNHEINNPLAGIQSMSEVLKESYSKFDDKQRMSAIDVINKSAQRLGSFASNLLDLSKLSTTIINFNKEEVDCTDTLRDRVDHCFKLYGNVDKQDIHMQIETDIVITSDQYYLSRVFDNLIINALTFCAEGEINIKLIKSNNEIRFSISDEGIGLPKDELHTIFDPFVVSSQIHTKAGYRGIGLALCKKIINLHGGSIWVKNNIGYGSTFHFMIPINNKAVEK